MSQNLEKRKTPILYVSHLSKFFSYNLGLRKKGKIRAVDDVSFQIEEGETLGIVGETGCGKTTLGRTILQLTEASEGDIYFDLPDSEMLKIMNMESELKSLTESDPEKNLSRIKELKGEIEKFARKHSLTRMTQRQLTKYRAKMQPVFQDPFSSLDPRKIIKDILAEPMHLLTEMSTKEIQEKTLSLLEEVGLNEEHLYRFPHEFSGGQRQRIGIARSISIEPKLLVLDEPTSALDVSVQAQILNTLRRLQRERNLTFIFISHNLSVVRMMSDKVAVMYLGKIAEIAETDALFTLMLHPYTKSLLKSIPIPDPKMKRQIKVLEGEIPSPSDPPKGCYFHSRCPEAFEDCGWSPRDLAEPLSDMLDPFRNPEAGKLPTVLSIVKDEEENQLLINFSDPINEQQMNLIKELIKKEASMKNGVKFRAITSVQQTTEPSVLLMKLKAQIEPKLIEIKKNHFVSCLLYDQGMNAPPGLEKGMETDALKTETSHN
jgi:oligopeptide/dipeptide ABC transporter ATP-binding protein